jgi:hypothetical protein
MGSRSPSALQLERVESVDVVKSCNRLEIVEWDGRLAFARLLLHLFPRRMFVCWDETWCGRSPALLNIAEHWPGFSLARLWINKAIGNALAFDRDLAGSGFFTLWQHNVQHTVRVFSSHLLRGHLTGQSNCS